MTSQPGKEWIRMKQYSVGISSGPSQTTTLPVLRLSGRQQDVFRTPISTANYLMDTAPLTLDLGRTKTQTSHQFLVKTPYFVSAFEKENKIFKMSPRIEKYPMPRTREFEPKKLFEERRKKFNEKFRLDLKFRTSKSPMKIFQLGEEDSYFRMSSKLTKELGVKEAPEENWETTLVEGASDPEEGKWSVIYPDKEIQEWFNSVDDDFQKQQNKYDVLKRKVNNLKVWRKKGIKAGIIGGSIFQFAVPLFLFRYALTPLAALGVIHTVGWGAALMRVCVGIWSIMFPTSEPKLDELERKLKRMEIFQTEADNQNKRLVPVILHRPVIARPDMTTDQKKNRETLQRNKRVGDKDLTEINDAVNMILYGMELLKDTLKKNKLFKDITKEERKLYILWKEVKMKDPKFSENLDKVKESMKAGFQRLDKVITNVKSRMFSELYDIYNMKTKSIIMIKQLSPILQKQELDKLEKIVEKMVNDVKLSQQVFTETINELLNGGSGSEGLYHYIKKIIEEDTISSNIMSSLFIERILGKNVMKKGHVATEQLSDAIYNMFASLFDRGKTSIKTEKKKPAILVSNNMSVFEKAENILMEIGKIEEELGIEEQYWMKRALETVSEINNLWLILHNYSQKIDSSARYKEEFGIHSKSLIKANLFFTFVTGKEKFVGISKDVKQLEAVENRMSRIRAKFSKLTFNLAIPFSIFYNGFLYTLHETVQSDIIKEYLAKYKVVEIFPEQRSRLTGYDDFETLISQCADDLMEGQERKTRFESQLRFLVGAVLMVDDNSSLFLIALAYFMFYRSLAVDPWKESRTSYYQLIKKELFKEGAGETVVNFFTDEKKKGWPDDIKNVMKALVNEELFGTEPEQSVFSSAEKNSFVNLLLKLYMEIKLYEYRVTETRLRSGRK